MKRILTNILFYVPQRKESHLCLEQHMGHPSVLISKLFQSSFQLVQLLNLLRANEKVTKVSQSNHCPQTDEILQHMEEFYP